MIVMADRGKRDQQRFEDRFGSDKAYTEYLGMASGFGAVSKILQLIEQRPELPKIVFVEGLDFLMEDCSKNAFLVPMLRWLAEIADYYNLAIIGSVGSPKLKIKNGYAATRDQIIASSAWGRMAQTILHLAHGDGDDMSNKRVLSVLKRNGPAERFELEWQDNRLVDYTPPEFDGNADDIDSSVSQRSRFSNRDFRAAFPRMSGSAAEVSRTDIIEYELVRK